MVSFRGRWSCLDGSGPHVRSPSAEKSTAALKKKHELCQEAHICGSTPLKSFVSQPQSPTRHTQTLRNRPGTSNGTGCVCAGRAPQGCHGFFFPLYVNLRMKSLLFLSIFLWVCVCFLLCCLCKPLDYTLSEFLWFRSAGHLTFL